MLRGTLGKDMKKLDTPDIFHMIELNRKQIITS